MEMLLMKFARRIGDKETGRLGDWEKWRLGDEMRTVG